MKKISKNHETYSEEAEAYATIKWGKSPTEAIVTYSTDDLTVPNRFDFGGEAATIVRNSDDILDAKRKNLFQFKNLEKKENK